MSPDERAQLIADMVMAFQNSKAQLTDEELQWVRLAIEAESRKIRFRDAVIEKSLAGLVWSGLVGIGYLIVDFFKNHGMR